MPSLYIPMHIFIQGITNIKHNTSEYIEIICISFDLTFKYSKTAQAMINHFYNSFQNKYFGILKEKYSNLLYLRQVF